MNTYDVIMTPSDDGSWVLKSEADTEIRRLQRALYIARAQAADGFATISRWTDYEDMHPDTKLGYRKWYKKFMHVKALCRAKAEAYK